MPGQRGVALLVALVVVLVVAASAGLFVWYMDQQQTRAGERLRAAAALTAAEAGVYRALAILEGTAPDSNGAGRSWRPTAYTEPLTVGILGGRFTLTLAAATDGGIVITSVGEVGGVARRLRARVQLASPALLAGLHATSFVRLEQPGSATVILPYTAAPSARPRVDIAAGRGLWVATTGVSLNNLAAMVELAPGPVAAPSDDRSAAQPSPGPVRLLLAGDADLLFGSDYRRVDIRQLRGLGVEAEGTVIRTEALPPIPEADRAYYRGLAAANTANAALNKAAGEYLGDAALARKRDSLYAQHAFQQVLAYLQTGRVPPRLQGALYVTGGVSPPEGARLQIADGTLITEHTVRLQSGASLEVTHSAATRTLPGLVVLGEGGLFVMEDARLRIHGLVLVSRLIDVNRGARLDVVGAVVGGDPAVSFRNNAATVVIRYDPAVLGTPGLRVSDGAPVVAWVAAWEERP